MIGIVAAVMLPIAAGHTPRGQEVGGAAFWAAICTYLILRRRNRTQAFASLFAVVALLATAPLIGLIDGVVNRDRYALNREFSDNPAISVIRVNDRKTYDDFLMRILKISREPADNAARGKIIAAEFASLYRRYLRSTTDAALISLYRANLRRLNSLRATDPERCYRYGLGQYTRAQSKEGISEENRESVEMMAAVIRAGINQPERAVHQGRAQESIDKAYAVAEFRLGADAHVLNLIDDPKANFAGACKGMIALMQSILELPPTESANVLRSFAPQ